MDYLRTLDYKFIYSHDANVDVSMEINRLELPLAAHPDECVDVPLWDDDDNDVSNGKVHDEEEVTSYPGPCRPFDFVRRGEELLVTVQVRCNGEALHGVPVSTYTPSSYDPERNCIYWESDLLAFPGVKYRDLSLDACLVFTVWGLGPRPVGATTLDFFGPYGALRMGKQKLAFRFAHDEGEVISTKDGATEYAQRYGPQDFQFRIEKAREGYLFNQPQLPPVGWLDRVTLPWTGRMLAELIQNPRHPREWALEQEEGAMERDKENRGKTDLDATSSCVRAGFLVVTLPMFQHPVLYDEKVYPGVVGVPYSGLAVAAVAGPSSPTASASGAADGGGKVPDEEGLTTAKVLNNLPGWELCAIYDCEAESDNPVESKYRKLAHDKFRGTGAMDPSLKPNKEERERIESLLASPCDHLHIEDKDLLWRFRYSLTDNKKALTKLLLSVDWSVEQEVQQVPALLEQWKAKTSIDLSDALKLLGREKAFQHEIVRLFAVDTLRRASDDELQTYLLQLVQALRYEAMDAASTNTTTPPMSSNEGLGGVGASSSSSSSSFSSSPRGASDFMLVGNGSVGGARSLILARFLIGRACRSLDLANFLYWYLRVELDDSTCGDLFKAVFEDFGRTLREINPVILDLLRKQDAYFKCIAEAQRVARDEKGRKETKEERMRNLLAAADMNGLPGGAPYVPMPLDPHVQVAGVTAGSAFMFRSALYPAVIQFRLYEQHQHAAGQAVESMDRSMASASSFIMTPRANSPSCYKVIFKSGDDLRQDQLIIQMVTLMDFLLKRVNLDLKLTPYRILATGPRDGMIEFVSYSSPVSEVLKEHGSIQNYFAAHFPEPGALYGVRPDVVSTFIKSCAGYCVITYLLGIGDRHLDNIMLLPQGHLFHIDFGFIFGQDPKPMPPPFRLAPQMVEAMGGENHENFVRFKRYCCQAYNCFRDNANLILTLLSLMVDAGIKDLAADPTSVLGKVEERFRLDLNVEQAELFFLSLVNESLHAFAPELWERVHRISIMRR